VLCPQPYRTEARGKGSSKHRNVGTFVTRGSPGARLPTMTADPNPPQREPERGHKEGAPPPTADSGGSSAAPGPKIGPKLTAEEQMELFEKHLKENDWGHQPC